MKDCDADAENTVGRSSSMSRSVYSLYKLYTLPMHLIWSEKEEERKMQTIKFERKKKVSTINSTSCIDYNQSDSLFIQRELQHSLDQFLKLKLLPYDLIEELFQLCKCLHS